MTRQWWAVTMIVAAREARQRVRGRAFRVATALVVVGVAAAIIIPKVTNSSSAPPPQHAGVIGTLTNAQQAALAKAARAAGVTVTLRPVGDRNAAARELRSGALDLVVDHGTSLVVSKSITSDDTSDTATTVRAFASALGVQAAIARAGLTARQVRVLYARGPVPVHALQQQKASAPVNQAAATIGLVVLFILLSQYLTWTLVGVMEEKSNRVVEVLLATVRAMQLLTGKLVGIGATVFLQAALIAGVALGLAAAIGSDPLHGPSPLFLGTTLLWLFLGYAFLSWVYAAAGSLVERQDQVQSLAIPLVIPMVVGYISAISAVAGGHASLFITVLAYLPPTAPFAMPALVALHAVAWWQFVLSILITLAATVVTARLAATVYRRAVLRTGGRVRLREVLGAGTADPRSS